MRSEDFDLSEFWNNDSYDYEFLKFEHVENKLSQSSDLHAFLLLDKLVPLNGRNIVAAAEHDIIYLETRVEDLLKVATDQDLIDLCRCGVMYQDDGLCMFA